MAARSWRRTFRAVDIQIHTLADSACSWAKVTFVRLKCL